MPRAWTIVPIVTIVTSVTIALVDVVVCGRCSPPPQMAAICLGGRDDCDDRDDYDDSLG